MTTFLSSKHYPSASEAEDRALAASLEGILRDDYRGSFFAMLAGYQKTLSDNRQKHRWEELHAKLTTLFKCGAYAPLDGPQIGVSMSIRDSDYFRETSKLFGKERSAIASIEWMASCWNMTFSGTGIWMGKTFEPVSRETVARKCENNALEMAKYDKATTRIGRNFFREPHNPGFLQLAGLPALGKLWHLKDRPESPGAEGFDSILLEENLAGEKHIPYTRTGGLFLANEGYSVVPGMNGKRVYQLNYRWPGLNPVYPMTRLVDELVQIDDGIFLGQLVMATRNYSIGQLNLPFLPGGTGQTLGPPYRPGAGGQAGALPGGQDAEADYGYQNNGFFLMIDTAYAAMAYADNAFPELRPHPGETGYKELGYDKSSGFFDTPLTNTLGARDDRLGSIGDWVSGWKNNASLQQKFTTFCLEPSPRSDDGDVRELLQDGESILQMLQRIKGEISAQTGADDRLRHFEKLNRLFRSGIAPTVKGGLFQGAGKGYNTRLDCLPEREWYGGERALHRLRLRAPSMGALLRVRVPP